MPARRAVWDDIFHVGRLLSGQLVLQVEPDQEWRNLVHHALYRRQGKSDNEQYAQRQCIKCAVSQCVANLPALRKNRNGTEMGGACSRDKLAKVILRPPDQGFVAVIGQLGSTIQETTSMQHGIERVGFATMQRA